MNLLASQIIVDILNTAMKLPAGRVWLRDQNKQIPTDTGLCIAVGIVNMQVISSETYIRDGVPSENWDQLGQTYDNTNQAEAAYDQQAVESYDQPGQRFDQGQSFDQQAAATTEVNKVQALEDIQIDIWSRNNDAIFRTWEVIAALNSIYAQQQMELVQFKIFRVPKQFINTSSAEGSAQLNRYTITISCLVWYVKETLLSLTNGDYYDDFTTRVDTAKTIGSVDYQYDQPGQTWDDGNTYDEPPPIITFEINQQGIEQ